MNPTYPIMISECVTLVHGSTDRRPQDSRRAERCCYQCNSFEGDTSSLTHSCNWISPSTQPLPTSRAAWRDTTSSYHLYPFGKICLCLTNNFARIAHLAKCNIWNAQCKFWSILSAKCGCCLATQFVQLTTWSAALVLL